MKRSLLRLAVVLPSVFAIALFSQAVTVQGQGGDPQYELILIEDGTGTTSHIYPQQINNVNQVVGFQDLTPGQGDSTYQAFLYDVDTRTFSDINEIFDTPETWVESRFYGINDWGAVVGSVVMGDTGERRGILVDTASGTWDYVLPPAADSPPTDFPNYVGNTAYQINNWGDVMGTFNREDGSKDSYVVINGEYRALGLQQSGWGAKLSNSRQAIVSDWGLDGVEEVSLYDLGQDASQVFMPPGFIGGFNDMGQICGFIPGSGKGKKAVPATAYRAQIGDDGNVITPLQWQATMLSQAEGLNLQGDVVGTGPNKGSDNSPVRHPFLYHDDLGMVDLDPHVDVSPEDMDLWQSSIFDATDISDRDSTGVGTIIGLVRYDNIPFVLVPKSTDPVPGITVDPTGGLVTTEGGDSAAFEVVLDSEPSANVTIGISSDNTNEGTVDKSSLTFTPGNWDTAQTVTVTGVDDEPVNETGDDQYTIVIAAANSTDPAYATMDPDDVSVTNLDNDGGGTKTYWQIYDFPDLMIVDQTTTESTITVVDSHIISSLTVTLDIFHERPSDLKVTLVGPDPEGERVRLFNYSGDNIVTEFNDDPFFGESVLGNWTLIIEDTKKKKTGTLNGWSLTVDF